MKWFSKKRAFYKMLFVILLICICFYVVGLLCNRYSYLVLEERIMDNMEEKALVWKNNLEQLIDSLLLAQSNLANDQSVLEVNVFWEQSEPYDRVETVTKLSNRLREIKILHSMATKIQIFFQEQGIVISNDYPLLDTYEQEELYDYRQSYVTEEGAIVLTTFFPLRIQDTARRKSAYYVRATIPPQNLKSCLEAGMREGEGGFAVLDKSGKPLISSDWQAEKEEAFLQLMEQVQAQAAGRENEEDFLVRGDAIAFCTYSSKMDVWLVYCHDQELLLEPLKFFGMLNLAITALGVLLFLAYAGYAAKTFARPLNRIMEAMERQADAGLIMDANKDEFAVIYSRYNQMVLHTNKLIQEKLEAQYQSRMAELRQLQYQIQPHFLYNSIFTIYRMAQMDGNEEIGEYTKHLGQYYQYITKSNDKKVKVSHEIEYLKNYLFIQHTRFGERIAIELEEVGEEVLALEIAPLLLQPLVENAYEHGLSEMVSGGRLHIKTAYEAPYFCFTVEDNGCGVTARQLQQIRQDLEQEEINTDVIHGLKNINVRIRLLYGKESCLFVDGRAEGGFRVMLQLRLTGEDDNVPLTDC